MSTVRDSISKIRIFLKEVSADDIISDRAIARDLKNTAIAFIRQQTDKRKLFASPNIFTPLNCVPMMEVPLSECCAYTSECMVSRSVEKIPKLSEGNYGVLVQGVWAPAIKLKKERYRYYPTTPDRYSNYLLLNLKKEQKFFWIMNDYLYVSDPNIEIISIVGYFEEDINPKLYSCDSSETEQECPDNPYDVEFRCPSFLIKDVEKETFRILMDTYMRSVADQTSDNREDLHGGK